MKEFGIHPLVAEELRSPTLRPKVDLYDNFIYLILHFPAFQHTHGHDPEQGSGLRYRERFYHHYALHDDRHLARIFQSV